MVVPDALMQDAATYAALETVVGPGCVGPHLVVRWQSERPSVNPAYAAERGFTAAEITATLRPWVAQQRDGARQLVEAAAAQLREAQALRDQAAEANVTMIPVG